MLNVNDSKIQEPGIPQFSASDSRLLRGGPTDIQTIVDDIYSAWDSNKELGMPVRPQTEMADYDQNNKVMSKNLKEF